MVRKRLINLEVVWNVKDSFRDIVEFDFQNCWRRIPQRATNPLEIQEDETSPELFIPKITEKLILRT